MRRVAPLLLLAAACQSDPTLVVGGDLEDENDDAGEDDRAGSDDGDAQTCTSEVDSFGVMCTTCTGDGAPTTECMPADCSYRDDQGCLVCLDPKDREATDCSGDLDPDHYIRSTGRHGGDGWFCSVVWGDPRGSQTNCQSLGVDSCRDEPSPDGGHCITCEFHRGGGFQSCAPDPDDPIIYSDETPVDLPPPGQCVSRVSPDGLVRCATCTREDQTAMMTCNHPAIEACNPDGADPDDPDCFECRRPETGDVIEVCLPELP
jgi:hypothetical protein